MTPQKKYRLNHLEKYREIARNQRRRYRDRVYAYDKLWKELNREKYLARRKVEYRLQTGGLIKKPCQVCNDPKSVGHHPDYSKPLEVIWLCRRHHSQVHLYEPWQIQMIETGYTGGFLLGELREACGDRFGELIRREGYIGNIGWVAKEIGGIGYFGKTPEEAVAALWLALNTKK